MLMNKTEPWGGEQRKRYSPIKTIKSKQTNKKDGALCVFSFESEMTLATWNQSNGDV